MISKQQAAIKSSIVDTNNCLNEIFLSFDSLNKEFYLGNRLVNFSSNCFSFYKADYSLEEIKAHYYSHLDNIVHNILSGLFTIVIISNTSIKNNITTSIAYVHSFSNILKKTFYYTINVMTTKVELFVIKYRIN